MKNLGFEPKDYGFNAAPCTAWPMAAAEHSKLCVYKHGVVTRARDTRMYVLLSCNNVSYSEFMLHIVKHTNYMLIAILCYMK